MTGQTAVVSEGIENTRYLSLCSGIGGFELGLNRAARALGIKEPECVGYSEIDKDARWVYENHFKHKCLGDIRELHRQRLSECDVLCAGFPCQAFSIQGRREGFSDERGSLFFEITRIIEQARPRFLLLENVKGLLSHERGRTFTTVLAVLDECGYDVQWQVLNSATVVPQNRERVFLVGHLRGTARPKVFPISIGLMGKPQCLGVIDEHDPRRLFRRQTVAYDANHIACCLLANEQGGMSTGYYRIGDNIRHLTPVECERLQTFPDNWTAGIGERQRYRCLGNSVTVEVVKLISVLLLKCLHEK